MNTEEKSLDVLGSFLKARHELSTEEALRKIEKGILKGISEIDRYFCRYSEILDDASPYLRQEAQDNFLILHWTLESAYMVYIFLWLVQHLHLSGPQFLTEIKRTLAEIEPRILIKLVSFLDQAKNYPESLPGGRDAAGNISLLDIWLEDRPHPKELDLKKA